MTSKYRALIGAAQLDLEVMLMDLQGPHNGRVQVGINNRLHGTELRFCVRKAWLRIPYVGVRMVNEGLAAFCADQQAGKGIDEISTVLCFVCAEIFISRLPVVQ